MADNTTQLNRPKEDIELTQCDFNPNHLIIDDMMTWIKVTWRSYYNGSSSLMAVSTKQLIIS